jgi:hypothetical protein
VFLFKNIDKRAVKEPPKQSKISIKNRQTGSTAKKAYNDTRKQPKVRKAAMRIFSLFPSDCELEKLKNHLIVGCN